MKTSPGYGSAPVESKLNTKVRYLDKPHFVSYLHLDIQKQNLRISRIRCRYNWHTVRYLGRNLHTIHFVRTRLQRRVEGNIILRRELSRR